jgi:glucose/arabinose dehydrogenase
MTFMLRTDVRRSIGACACLGLATAATLAAIPPGFSLTQPVAGLTNPTALAFAPDGRIFIAEQRGVVKIVQNDQVLAQPFIDLQQEITNGQDRGLLGLALDPQFMSNGHVYLLYTVDPTFGEPNEPVESDTFARVVRYTAQDGRGGNVADLSTRLVLLGEDAANGIPACSASHTIGSLRFGHDGSLFISSGDGAHFEYADAGGNDPGCTATFGPSGQDTGAFRSQDLDSPAGKILRIHPDTGAGMPDNPYFTGDGDDVRSKVWASGVRNPFRIALKPHSPSPGTIFIGDVGWFLVEEINVAHGGENFGWPCNEGPGAAPDYPNLDPASAGCDTIQTRDNPGPLTPPIIHWQHSGGGQSFPPGIVGSAALGGAFMTGPSFPSQYSGGLFYADFIAQWIRVLLVNEQDQFIGVLSFGTAMGNLTDLAFHPITGELHYITHNGLLRRVSFVGTDLNHDHVVDGADLGILLLAWGACPGPGPCPADFNADASIDGADLGFLLLHWD